MTVAGEDWSERVHLTRSVTALDGARSDRSFQKQTGRTPVRDTSGALAFTALLGLSAVGCCWTRIADRLGQTAWHQLPIIRQFHELIVGPTAYVEASQKPTAKATARSNRGGNAGATAPASSASAVSSAGAAAMARAAGSGSRGTSSSSSNSGASALSGTNNSQASTSGRTGGSNSQSTSTSNSQAATVQPQYQPSVNEFLPPQATNPGGGGGNRKKGKKKKSTAH